MQNLTSLTQSSAGNITLKTGKTLSLGGASLPSTSDGAALGSATKMWSDLFLASGGVINFNNGNVAVTHVSGGVDVTAAAGPTTATDVIHVVQTLSANWTGSQACLRLAATSSATGAIGNARPLMVKLDMAAQPSSQGHTAAGYFEGATTDASTNLTGIVSLTKSGTAGGAATPFLYVEDAGTTKTGLFMTLATVGAGTADEMVRTNVNISNVSELTLGIKVSINGSSYYLIGIKAADV